MYKIKSFQEYFAALNTLITQEFTECMPFSLVIFFLLTLNVSLSALSLMPIEDSLKTCHTVF